MGEPEVSDEVVGAGGPLAFEDESMDERRAGDCLPVAELAEMLSLMEVEGGWACVDEIERAEDEVCEVVEPGVTPKPPRPALSAEEESVAMVSIILLLLSRAKR